MAHSTDAGVKTADDMWKTLGRSACLIGLSLVCALMQFRLIMLIFGLKGYRLMTDAALGVVTGHPYWRISQSRLLGPWLVQAMTPIFGSFLGAHVAFSILALTAAGLLAWRIGGWLGFLALQFGFAVLLSPPWLYAWDYLDLIAFLVFVKFVKDRRPWPWFVGLYAVAIWNRDSAQFIALWLVLEGLLRRQWRPAVAGIALIPAGMLLLECLRRTLLIEETWAKVFHLAPGAPTANAAFGLYLGQNLDWGWRAIMSPDFSGAFLNPVYLAGFFGVCILLIRRGAVALGLTFTVMAAADLMFAPLMETRAMIYLIPSLVALCHAEAGPPYDWFRGWLAKCKQAILPQLSQSQEHRHANVMGAPPEKNLARLALVMVAATLAVYWPALRGDFIWDDDVMVRSNPFVKSPQGLYYIWCSTRLPDFFPLTSTSFWLEWRLWGLNATGYHVTNVLLHAASAVILWRVLRRLAVPGAWLAALVFAIHPVNVESVAWIAERKNTLTMFFYALTLWCYVRFEEQSRVLSPESRVVEVGIQRAEGNGARVWYGLALFAFLLALLSKTSVVMFPFVILGCAWWRRGRITWMDLRRSLPFFGLSLVLGLVTLWFQYHRVIAEEVVQTGNFWARLAGAGWAVWFYLGKALVPLHLIFVYPRWEVDAHTFTAYLPALALVLVAAGLWRYGRNRWRGVSFALGYFVVMLFPILGFLNIYFQRYSLVADHWQYFSIIGPIALLAGAGSNAIRSNRRFWRVGASVGAAAGVGLLAVLSWRQASVYASAESIWRDTLVKNPKAWIAHNNLGLLEAAQRRLPEAKAHYSDALRLKPDQVEAHINLGSALMAEGRLDEAGAQFEAARKFNPECAMAYYNLGILLDQQGKGSDAMAQYRRALEARPDYPEAHNNLAAGLVAEGKVDEAIVHFREAVRGNPDYAAACNNLGSLLFHKGNLDEAFACLTRALAISPGYAEAHHNLGDVLVARGRGSEAEAHYLAALQSKPDLAEVHLKVGGLLLARGNAEEAATHFAAALQSRPNYAEAHYQLAAVQASHKQIAQAVVHFREAVRLVPDWAEALNNLAWILATQTDAKLRDGAEAVRLATHAVELTKHNSAGALDTLAAAYAEAGRFPEAAKTAQLAIVAATEAAQNQMAAELRGRLALYEAGRPYREQ